MQRHGPEFGMAFAPLYRELRATVMASCGVPAVLSSPDAQGSQLREAYRWWLQSSLRPKANILAAELTLKLGSPVAFEFPGMTAADIGARARAVSQLTTAGVEIERALELVGLAS